MQQYDGWLRSGSYRTGETIRKTESCVQAIIHTLSVSEKWWPYPQEIIFLAPMISCGYGHHFSDNPLIDVSEGRRDYPPGINAIVAVIVHLRDADTAARDRFDDGN